MPADNDQATRRAFSRLPSVDHLLRTRTAAPLLQTFGRQALTEALRETLAGARDAVSRTDTEPPSGSALLAAASARLQALHTPSLRRVFNLTGTVLHTNLGRAPLPPEAINAVAEVAAGASNLEFDLDHGQRGDRDRHVEGWLTRLTGAQAATVVNNNAAAVLLALNTLAARREVLVSRGELIEIGGAFRMPDIMARAGCRLREVGTTNRTHPHDFSDAIGTRTAAVMKVHTSNYSVHGFTAEVSTRQLAGIAAGHGLPSIVDLGSGTLIDLRHHGLPAEPTVRDTLEAGADLVTFSGDKLLGGPQAGLLVGRADLVARIKRNPLRRALRVDKMTLAALGAVLPMYANPERVCARLPALALLTRPAADIEAMAGRVAPLLQDAIGSGMQVSMAPCHSQVGSGSLPVDRLPGFALRIARADTGSGRRRGGSLRTLSARFRALPVPVIGRLHDDALWLDLRCLDDEARFVAQLPLLVTP